MKLDIKKFTTGKFAVYCEDQRDFMELLEIVHNAGICNDDLYDTFQRMPLEPSDGYPIYVFYHDIHSLAWANVNYILRSDEECILFKEICNSPTIDSGKIVDLLLGA